MNGSMIYNGNKVILMPGRSVLEKGLEATLEIQQVTDTAEFAVLKLKNVGTENTYQIQQPKTLDLHVVTQSIPSYHGMKGDSCGAASFMPQVFEVKKNWHEEPCGGRSSDETGFPFFDISWENKTMVVGIGWTGQWSKDIFINEEGFSVQIGLCDSDFYLRPGEEVRLPSVLVVSGQEPAETRRKFRRILREEFSPKKRQGEKFSVPMSIQCFDRYFWGKGFANENGGWASERGQMCTVDEAKKLEYIDTLWLDAAWFEKGFPHGVGNYTFSAGFPNGLKPVSDHAHKSDMRFVLWFEPERVYEGSDLYEQTEKLLCWEKDANTRLYNLADPAALEWLKQKLISMIRENGIDVYRQDFNMRPLPYWRQNDEPDRKGITEIRYIMGLYHLWDTLLAEFPDLLIDNCASGGRRLDLETAMRSVTLWRSDTGCSPESDTLRNIVWNNNQILALSEYLPYHACAVWDTDAYTVRSTQTHGMACTFDIFNPEFDFEKGREVLKEAQEMRTYWDGDFYPLTEITIEEDVWAAYQLALEEGGAVYAFRRELCDIDKMVFKLNAIDPDAVYKVTFVDEYLCATEHLYAGQKLLEGIELTIPEKRNSLIVKYQKTLIK